MTLRDVHDQAALGSLAIQLDGEPLPGVRMTEKQFENWCDEETRAEWVNGEVILLSPANEGHDDLHTWLVALLRIVVQSGGLGKVSFDLQVRLGSPRARRNPDIAFVAQSRLNIVKATYIDGAPDLIIEIVSPDSENRDRRDKYLAYERNGVREYWIIDPQAQRVEAYRVGRDKKYHRIKETAGRIRSNAIRRFYLRPDWLWRSPLPQPLRVLREMGIR